MNLLHRLTFKHNAIRRNAVFGSGIAVVPVIAAATNLLDSVLIAVCFTLVLLPAALICALIPHRLVYSVRVALYSAVASLIYIPVFLLLSHFVPRINDPYFSVYLCICVCNPILLAHIKPQQTRKESVKLAAAEVGGLLAGFDFAVILTGFARELAGVVGLSTNNVFAGFIAVGLLGACLRRITSLLNR